MFCLCGQDFGTRSGHLLRASHEGFVNNAGDCRLMRCREAPLFRTAHFTLFPDQGFKRDHRFFTKCGLGFGGWNRSFLEGGINRWRFHQPHFRFLLHRFRDLWTSGFFLFFFLTFFFAVGLACDTFLADFTGFRRFLLRRIFSSILADACFVFASSLRTTEATPALNSWSPSLGFQFERL